MIKKIIFIILVLLNGCYSQKTKSTYFTFKIPKFSEEQNKIIKKIYPIIIQDLDEPGNYYIAKIKKINGGIRVIVPYLQILQNGIYYEKGIVKATADFPIHVYLFNNDLVTYTRIEADFNDLTEIENDSE